jgi:hypothetical protein
MVDEDLPSTGLTHLLEHLALHDRARGPLHVNGTVSLCGTRFDAHGPADQVAAAFTAIAGWLAAPELTEREREQRVLRAEAAFRGGNDVGIALLNRYGAQGPGLAGYAEPGLSRATDDDLRALAARAFTRGNAALFLDGPPPPGLQLGLPDGSPRPTPVARPCEDDLPAAYAMRQGIALSGAVPRTAAATILPLALREVLNEDLREREGGAYAPWSHYEPVDDEVAVAFAGSDASPALLPTLVDRTLERVREVQYDKVLEAVVPDIVSQVVQHLTDPYNAPALAHRAAADHLRGVQPQTLDEVVEEMRSVSPQDVAEVAHAFRASLLLGVDAAATWNKPMRMLSMRPITDPIDGRARRSASYPSHRERLVVGERAVQVRSAAGARTIERKDVAGLFLYPDGGRDVVARDGWNLTVEPRLWSGGSQAVAALDAMVPSDLHIPMLERPAEQLPRPMTNAEQARHLWKQARSTPMFVTTLSWLLVVGLIGGLYWWTGRFTAAPIAGALGASAWTWYAQRRDRAGPA